MKLLIHITIWMSPQGIVLWRGEGDYIKRLHVEGKDNQKGMDLGVYLWYNHVR